MRFRIELFVEVSTRRSASTGVENVAAAVQAVERAGHALVEPLRDRPWGLRDFRLADPDGYSLRVTTAAP